MRFLAHLCAPLAAGFLLSSLASAEPLVAPGDVLFRHDLQLLNDNGIIDVPLTAWPVSLGDVAAGLDNANGYDLSEAESAAMRRVRDYLSFEMEIGAWTPTLSLALAENPQVIRTFEATPREKAEAAASLSWLGERFAFKLEATVVADPFDGEEIRPDGTYVGVALGNWSITAGWQERWWGPGRDGSLILGTNARPLPGIALQRIASRPFETKWLSWMGPWTFTTFMSQLDDDRVVNNALMFGMRGSFRPPHTGLEIGISRTAQWCGDDRPCGLDTFVDLLLGKDNRDVNVDPDDEPGNQLAGIDIRWRLPETIPVALYMQWAAEDGRGGGQGLGSWIRQIGIEHWGQIGKISHRTHFEVADTMCREGGFGFSDKKPNCAYEHYIYETGYRYRGRVIGHPTDADSRTYSIGSTLVQSGGHVWNVAVRHMEINRLGAGDSRHSISSTPLDILDMQVSYQTVTRFGSFYAGVGFAQSKNLGDGSSRSDVTGFLRWSSR